MSFLADQAIRLLRTKWASPMALAEEIYAIFNSDTGTTINGPVTINNPTNQPAITINNGGLGDVALQYNKTPPSPYQFQIPGLDLPPIPPLTPPDTPGFEYSFQLGGGGNLYVTEGPSDEPLPPAQPVAIGTSAALPVYGQITGGSGNTYTVQPYSAGTDPTALPGFDSLKQTAGKETITVTQLQIDPSATIPAGTWVVCYAAGYDDKGKLIWVTQVPVWLAPQDGQAGAGTGDQVGYSGALRAGFADGS
jgi:hypothetical protein